MRTGFGGRVANVSGTESALVAHIKALKAVGGHGIFYRESEGTSPFTGCYPGRRGLLRPQAHHRHERLRQA